jgi:hypothetical protein
MTNLIVQNKSETTVETAKRGHGKYYDSVIAINFSKISKALLAFLQSANQSVCPVSYII